MPDPQSADLHAALTPSSAGRDSRAQGSFRRALGVAVLSAALVSQPASAAGVSVLGFGVEVDAETLAVLAQLTVMTGQAVELYNKTQEGVDTAQRTLAAFRDANEAVKSSLYFLQNPDEVLNEARRDFFTSFRELDTINREAAALHQSLASAPTGFDPSAYRRAFDSAVSAGNAYQTFLAFREKDYGNLGAESLRTLAGMEIIAKENDNLRADLEKRENLTQKEAAAISAKANVDASVAAATSARQLTEMLRLMQLQQMDAQAARLAEDERRAAGLSAAGITGNNAATGLAISAQDDLASIGKANP